MPPSISRRCSRRRRILIAALCHGPQVLISTEAFPKGTQATGVHDIQRDLKNAGFAVQDKPAPYTMKTSASSPDSESPAGRTFKAFCDEIGKYARRLIQERT